MNVWGRILKFSGWRVVITAPRRDKCVICVAPHTSNLDFIIGLAAYRSLGREANFLMKDFWFFFPLGVLMRRLGGIPVKRKGPHDSLTKSIVRNFNQHRYLNLAVTPEGTRGATAKWKTGFIYIARDAGVPVQLGILDYSKKAVIIKDEYLPTGDVDRDMAAIKSYYAGMASAARYPEKFRT